MVCSASFVHRWSRLLSSNFGYKLPVPKHHIWMLNRPFLTSKINERGKGLHKELTSHGYRKRNIKDHFNEVQSVLYNSNARIIVFIYPDILTKPNSTYSMIMNVTYRLLRR